MTLKHLVFALAVAAASAVAPFPRGSTEAVGDTFEMGKAVAKNDATLAVDMTPKLRGGAEGMAFTASALPAALDPWFLPQGNEGDDVLYATGDSNWLYVCPASTLPWHRSRPRFLPQGGDGNDSCKKDGVYYNGAFDDCEVGLP